MNPPNGSKPFDLAAALAGAPVVTRDGRPVYRLVYDTNRDQPLVPYLFEGDGPNDLRHWSDGTFFLDKSESTFDLFMARKAEKVWINLYGSAEMVKTGSKTYGTEALAGILRCDRIFEGILELPYLKSIEVEVPA